jgi:hypothetical protein
MNNLLKAGNKIKIKEGQAEKVAFSDLRKGNKSIMPEKAKNQADRILNEMEESYQTLEKVLNAFNRMP